MDQEQVEPAPPLRLPARVSEGMPVYDRDDHEIGTVQLVYFGGASKEAIDRVLRPREPHSADPHTSEHDWGTFGADDVPAALRARLLRDGYIRIEGPGISGVKCYITPEQIAGVTGTGVRLGASRDELIKT